MADRPNGMRVVLPSRDPEPTPLRAFHATITPSTKIGAWGTARSARVEQPLHLTALGCPGRGYDAARGRVPRHELHDALLDGGVESLPGGAGGSASRVARQAPKPAVVAAVEGSYAQRARSSGRDILRRARVKVVWALRGLELTRFRGHLST